MVWKATSNLIWYKQVPSLEGLCFGLEVLSQQVTD